MSSNVGGSAGDGGFQFQAKIIAFVAVHILAEARLTGLEGDIEGIPIAVAAETNGPGDDVHIELARPDNFIELQAKKGLRVDARFDKAVEKIATGLRQDTASMVVLAVDPTAASRIRQKLAVDLRRLRQGREDTPHDQDLFNRVIRLFAVHAKDEEETRTLARRLFVHTFDVQNADLQTGLTLLRSRVLVDERQAKAAWKLLEQAGHELITDRGRYDAASLVRYLQNESDHTIHLRHSLPPVAKNQYQSWLSGRTATFSIPGPSGVLLPIGSAWTELHVLPRQDAVPQQDIEELLSRYHEWEELADRADYGGYGAKDVAEIGDQVVIVGGPGAGKSTLCRRLAHDFTELEEVVLWISLSAVANRIRNGMNINTALIDAATDGFGLPFDVREALFAQADRLIADGLDECGESVVTVAEALQGWATAHPITRIVITSRPIGYETKYFPMWEHYVLAPLTQNQVQTSSQELIKALAANAANVEGQAARFREQLKHHHVASLAARNPLLLGFLIQLFLEGESLAKQRAGLYEQILDLWCVSIQLGRNWHVPRLDRYLAWRALEIIGWLLLSSEKGPTIHSYDQLVQQLHLQLARERDTRQLYVNATASDCLQFWHERGVLDRFQIGHKDYYAFVHTAFNEFVAGRYLASLSAAEIQWWVRDKYRDARWREPFLLAAGSGAAEVILETLLAIDSEDGQAKSALLLAMAALAESPLSIDTLARITADRLIIRLVSSESSFAYEAAEWGVGFVKRRPDLFASRLRPLFWHAQKWTCLSAMYLALGADDTMIDIDRLGAFFDDLSANSPSVRKGRVRVSPELDMQNKVLRLGASALARLRPDARIKEQLQAIYVKGGDITQRTHEKLREILLDLGCHDFIEEREKEWREDMLVWFARGYQADQNMLETILRLTSSPVASAKRRRKLRALTVLLYALGVHEAWVGDWDILSRLDDSKAIEAVLSGYISALRLNKDELAQDAAWALAELGRLNQHGVRTRSLFSLLPRFPASKEEFHADSINTSVPDLVRALKHPSTIIAYGAAQILTAIGEGREEIAALLLTSNDEKLLHIISAVAAPLWQLEARPLLIKRLGQGYTEGSWWLIEELPYLPGEHTDPEFQQALLLALQAEDPRVAISAIHALQELDVSHVRDMASALQSALLHWTEQGEGAKVRSLFYVVDGCPTCRAGAYNDACTHVKQLLDRL